MKKLVLLFAVVAMCASTSVMAQDTEKKSCDKTKTECASKKEGSSKCCSKKEGDSKSCGKKESTTESKSTGKK